VLRLGVIGDAEDLEQLAEVRARERARRERERQDQRQRDEERQRMEASARFIRQQIARNGWFDPRNPYDRR
jgi:hypothetical protein